MGQWTRCWTGNLPKTMCIRYSFANNPPGRHAVIPTGGDEVKDPAAAHADAAAGAGTGAVVGGVIAGPPGAAVGAGFGAYVGSLVGALHGLKDSGSDDRPMRRPAGILVAMKIDSASAEESAIHTLRAHGAIHVEKADGRWRDGRWMDFDPVSAPVIV